MSPRLLYTRHAEEMVTERRIEREWVEQTIASPEMTEPDPGRPEVTRAFRRIPQRGGRILRVAYVATGDTMRIVTVFFDRNATARQGSRTG